MRIFYLLLLASCFAYSSASAQNTAVQLNGTADHLVVKHKDVLNVSDDFTVEAWIYANNWTSESWRGTIVGKDGPSPDAGYAFRCGNNGSLSFVMSEAGTWNEIMTGPTMNTKQWHHVAATINNGTSKLYIDGQVVATGSYTGALNNNTRDLKIGESAGFGGRFFDGVLDEIRIWNVARTDAEIADNTTTDFTGSEAGLVAYFPMNDGQGSIATNLVDANCSATGLGIDDGSWVEGYSLPEFDLSLKSIEGIDRVNVKTRPSKISVGIQNVGREAISDYELSLNVDGDFVFSETANVSIPAGEQISYTFSRPLDLTDNPDPIISINLSHPDDANSLNNFTEFIFNNEQGNTIAVFEEKVHNFGANGQNHNTSIVLPADLSNYERVLLHVNLKCPTGGCDDWDQPAKIIANTSQGNFEIARYITPYGIACGPWTVDITDFKSVLTGNVEFVSFIQVWGQTGWAADIDIELIEGSDPMPYSKLTGLWNNDYLVYGDPDISHDLDEIVVSTASNTEASHVRMQITGHGQGNTSNAAEFFNVTHGFFVDGNKTVDHNLWKADCAANSCSGQAGNWAPSRAGWCPGQEVIPAIFETTNDITAGNDVRIDYVLQDYTNLLNTGYNSSGHTEPHYRAHGFFIEKSTSPYVDYNNLQADNINAIFDMNDFEVLEGLVVDITNSGNTTIDNFMVQYYVNGELLVTENVNFTLNPGDVYAHDFNDLQLPSQMSEYTFFVEVLADEDQNPGDNITKSEVYIMVGTLDAEIAQKINIYPNPSIGFMYIEMDEAMISGQLELYHADGRLITTQVIRSTTEQLYIGQSGSYLLRLSNQQGEFTSRRVAIID